MACNSTNFSGENVYINWIYSGGTIVLHTDFTNVSINPGSDRLDSTAGADKAQELIGSIERYNIAVDLYQRTYNDATLGGTLAQAALKRDTCGTAEVYPEGTAIGRRKITMPAISGGLVEGLGFNSLATWSITFDQSGGTIDYGVTA